MKSAFEIACAKKRESAEGLIRDECPDLIEMMCSFSHLDCIIDVKRGSGWERYELVEGGEDEPNTLRRLG